MKRFRRRVGRRSGGRACRLLTVAVALAGSVLLGTTTGAAQPPGYLPPEVPTEWAPPQPDHLGAVLYMKDHPAAVPWGANDFGCVPDAAHPRPVILAHGTDASAYTDWSAIGPRLVDAGFCVFALNYGGKPGATSFGTEDIVLSAHQLAGFVSEVRTATGADRVDLVGFSQGANVTRYYINKLGGAPAVGTWVGLASPSYGGVMYGLVPVAQQIPGALALAEKVISVAAVQQAQGSPFMLALNAGGDTVPGVRYVTIGSRVDEMIQPSDNMALRGPGAENILIQDRCPADLTGHFHMVYDPFVAQLLLEALDPQQAPSPVCLPVALGTGIPQVVIGGNI
ncbi:esterase/lipase family protein [Nocardia sp. CA-290969]|uniref:esterase/lipase family protein n=1 Tax=Nocardia sp. CA-290969 TaxID=3239986 RepID=UPI003D8F07E5